MTKDLRAIERSKSPPETIPQGHSWGGRRPGAGAPAGNFNALKHGRRSAQLRQLFLRASRSRQTRALVGTVAAAALIAKAGLVRSRRHRAGRRQPGPDGTSKEATHGL